jgi:hypothetical protein
MYHGQAEQERRHQSYLRSEVISHGEKLRQIEARLNEVNARLAFMEAMLTNGHIAEHADPQ